ncbi:virulence-associated E family protein [Microcoleus sp. F8_C2]
MSMGIDRDLAEKHLSYLGYKPGEAFLRFFYHSSDDRKKKDKGRKESQCNWTKIEEYQRDGRGVYVVVNGADGTGHTDADIKQCCAIFCEWDDIPLAEQFEKWSEIGFVEPTFTVYSGDKSMQPYWVFDEPIAPEQWRELQILLIQVMEADESNKNPSRVFRLAGAWHVKPEREPRKTEIVGESGLRYSYSDLRDRLLDLYREMLIRKQRELEEQHQAKIALTPPMTEAFTAVQRPVISNATATDTLIATDTATATGTATATLSSPLDFPKYKDLTVPVPIPISLVGALGKPNKEFLNGVATLRNTSMATLARDLLGVQSEFNRLGQTTNEDAYTLFLDACQRCSPGGGWDEQEWEQIWNSAVRSNPIASISKYYSDGIESCIKGEYWRFLKAQQPSEALSEPESESLNNSKSSDFNIFNSDDKMIQDYKKLARHFGKRIRLNKLSKRIEIDGKPVSLDRAKIQLVTRHSILVKSSKEDIQDILTEIAEENQYSPIEDYLNGLPTPEHTSILDNMAERYLGVAEPIYQTFVRKSLIGAVARALSPGCKLDTALILQGKQGFKKSTFFKILAGDYFDDSLGAVSDKDERLKLHRSWFIEWSELESIFKRRDVSQTKAFLSSSIDAVRPPYCRDTQDFARASIIVATTNKDEFLSDETGNRRFWIIPVKKRINTKLLRQERDAIWAAAVLAYKSGEQWWLDYEDEEKAETIAGEFQTSDPWMDTITNYTEYREWLLMGDLLNHLQVDLSRQERSHQMRVASILKLLGWQKNFRTVAGKRCRVWCKPEPDREPEREPEPEPDSESGSTTNTQNRGVDQEDGAEDVQAEIQSQQELENQTQQVDQHELPKTQKKDIFAQTETAGTINADLSQNSEFRPDEKSDSFGEKLEQVDRTNQPQSPQAFQSDQPENSQVDQQKTEALAGAEVQEKEEAELIDFIRYAIAENDSQFAKDIQVILKEVCTVGAADRQKVWDALTEAEKVAFTALLGQPTSPTTPTEPIEQSGQVITTQATEPTEPVTDAPTDTPADVVGEPPPPPIEQIEQIDAEKMREIALIWWDEFYPEQMQSLISQMYAWKAPGTKYSQEAIDCWLKTQDEIVKERITEIIEAKNGQRVDENND